MKECPLRKPCAICKKLYGRVYRKTGQLESIHTWERGCVCSAGCRHILRVWSAHVRREARRLAAMSVSVLDAALGSFLY